MQLKCWLLIIRILNISCAVLMTAFEIWYVVELFESRVNFLIILIRIFTPIFVILLAIVIITAEFKYSKVVEHFKFLQLIPGLALFDVFIASILAFQFSTVDIYVYCPSQLALPSLPQVSSLASPSLWRQWGVQNRQAPKASFRLKIDCSYSDINNTMDNCCSCIQSRQVEEAYIADRNRATYNSGYSQAVGSRPNQQTILGYSRSHRELPTYSQTPINLQQSQLHISRYEQMKAGNQLLRRQIQNRKVDLWERVDRLKQRSDQLRSSYIERDAQLRGLLGQINRYYK